MDWLISVDIKVGIRGGDVKGRHMRAPKMCKDPYTKTNLKNDDKKMNKRWQKF